jgi:excisionase family DNA binding protein
MHRRARPGFELDLTEAIQSTHEDHNRPREQRSSNEKRRHEVASRPIPQLYTVPEAAGMLRLSVRTVRRLIAEQKIAAIRIGRAVRICEEALRTLIEESDIW